MCLLLCFLTADSHSQATGVELLDSVAAAEREIAATPEYAPLAEWEVRRVVPVNDTLLPYQVCTLPASCCPSVNLSSCDEVAACELFMFGQIK